MEITETEIPEVLLIEPQVFRDDRGSFLEVFSKRKLVNAGISEEFVQMNHSKSLQNVLRGIHYQIKQPQGKLVQVVSGSVFDVAVDLRRSSPTFGNYVGEVLSGENNRQLWIPPGFGHAFLVLSEIAHFVYLTTDFYAPEWERTILWDDQDIGIDWPITQRSDVILSEKDLQGRSLKDAELY